MNRVTLATPRELMPECNARTEESNRVPIRDAATNVLGILAFSVQFETLPRPSLMYCEMNSQRRLSHHRFA